MKERYYEKCLKAKINEGIFAISAMVLLIIVSLIMLKKDKSAISLIILALCFITAYIIHIIHYYQRLKKHREFENSSEISEGTVIGFNNYGRRGLFGADNDSYFPYSSLTVRINDVDYISSRIYFTSDVKNMINKKVNCVIYDGYVYIIE